ncbi:MAG: hypothetical protein EVJ47_07960 [Candidatus Acidulodesulfobacterium ferriphilum]|uniref:Uncharacterized protein n=1 Tax=Candidatus Acidulodesulfobacterium ferriphilum TaxID=2597223 RepID=A0A519BA99_9DELT|nr:MAG: hypothetical protein EVJ47_07960 [Candidatus Acidulodesulfobacterium ferriphilum]
MEQVSNFWNSFLSALIGAMVGGIFVLIGAFLSFHYDSKKEEKQRKELINSFLNGVYHEIESFWELDMVKSAIMKLNSISKDDKYFANEIERLLKNPKDDELNKLIENILPENIFIELFYIRREEYFLIYNNNANLIGKITDKELIRLIINAYNKIKGLLDLFDINNDYRKKYIYFLEQYYHKAPPTHFDRIELLTYMRILRENAIRLKNSYREVEEAKNILFEKLKTL